MTQIFYSFISFIAAWLNGCADGAAVVAPMSDLAARGGLVQLYTYSYLSAATDGVILPFSARDFLIFQRVGRISQFIFGWFSRGLSLVRRAEAGIFPFFHFDRLPFGECLAPVAAAGHFIFHNFNGVGDVGTVSELTRH